jgi:hypothetical protein
MSVGHEQKDVDVVSIFLVAITLLLGGALICFVIWGFVRFLAAKDVAEAAQPNGTTVEGAVFPSPSLQVEPPADLEKLRVNEERRLNSYAWIDPANGFVRIPIARAMQLMIERGLPEVGRNQTPLQLMQSRSQQPAAQTLPGRK